MSLPQNFAHQAASFESSSHTGFVLPEESVIFGKSEPMVSIRAKLKTIASSNLPVLIQGENGTGKLVIARLLHEWSPLTKGIFLQVSCPSIPGTALESELFGYENNYGHERNGHGQIRFAASGGTLCLDEIGELDSALQAKLLQVLQNGRFCPLNGSPDLPAEIRLVCVTSRDLERDIALNKFRRDLFYRINVVKLQLPTLRERIADLPQLCAYFLDLYSREFNCEAKPLSAVLLHQLQKYQWPGNIRQLENLIKRYVVLGSEDVFQHELNGKMQPSYSFPEIHTEGSLSLAHASREVRRAFERELILKALEANHGNRRRAALALNISYRALLYKLKESQNETPVQD